MILLGEESALWTCPVSVDGLSSVKDVLLSVPGVSEGKNVRPI
jgi:hypothetical protein